MNNANNIEVVVSVPSRGNGVIDFCTGAFHALANGFRPLSGKWGYRFEYRAIEDALFWLVSVPSRGNGVIDQCYFGPRYRADHCFRPLSGKWGYRFGKRFEKGGGKGVSVPSRGNGVIDPPNHGRFSRQLPSCFRPLSGKWGYRFMQFLVESNADGESFRPLSGKWGYRLALLGMIDGTIVDDKFPSPLGEMGLSIGSMVRQPRVGCSSFRPLSGKWGYRLLESCSRFAIRLSFRPLSGKWGYR